ncbi:MAG: bifunctional precorrin-2 dehydrogenase/sirohydrochlorin ferrochelatase [Bryobacteraceae bacterium]
MDYYPIYLDLRGRRVLVAGAGKVALRKTRGLLEAGARVVVVAPRWLPEFESLPVELRRRPFEPADLEGACLAFTAADNREVNRGVASEARKRGIPVNVADVPGECDFIVPARLERGGVQIAISTGARDPRLAARMRRRLEDLLSEP